MKMISNNIKVENITICNEKKKFEEVLKLLVDILDVENKNEIFNFLIKQEVLLTSLLGKGVLFFRAWPTNIKKLKIILGIFPTGCDIEAFDEENIKIAVLLAASKEDEEIYHNNLISILRMLNDTSLREDFIECKTAEEVIELIRKEEEEIESSN